MAVGRVVQGHRRIDGAGVSENFQQCARGEFVGDGVVRQPGQPQTVEGGGFDEGCAVEGEAGGHAHAVDLPVFGKLPVVQAVKGVERGHDAAVLHQFGRRFRLPVAGEIVGHGNDAHRPFAQKSARQPYPAPRCPAAARRNQNPAPRCPTNCC